MPRTLLPGLIILLVAVGATGVMWAPALLAGHSAWFDLARMASFDAALRAGDFFPVWSPDFYFGYGSPLFQFYAPLAYYLAEIPVLAGVSIPSALKLTALLALFASGAAMYQLAARHVSTWSAVLAAVLYMVAPYRLVDLFVRHAFAEHCAFMWLPWITLGTERFVAERSRGGLLLAAVCTAGLTFTHNVMALIGLPVCVAAGWLLAEKRPAWKTLPIAGAPALFGVGLAGFFWWPALHGRAFTHAEESLTGGYFEYRQHFVAARQFTETAWSFGESGVETTTPMPLQIGWPHLVVVLAALLLVLMKRRRVGRWTVVALAITAGAIFMCHGSSQALWAALPLVKYVQFPWRFLGLVALGAAMCGAAAFDCLHAARPRWERPAFGCAALLVLAVYFPYYSEARFVAVDARSQTLVQVTPRQLDALASIGALGSAASLVTPETIRAAGERATSSDDFLPRGVRQKPASPAEHLFTASGGEIRRWTRLGVNRYEAAVTMHSAGRIELAQFWFPGWTARVDGRAVPAEASGASAVVSCAVPPGGHTVEFACKGLPQRRTGLALTFVSALFLLAAFVTLPRWSPVS